jgi:hypothetical protein
MWISNGEIAHIGVVLVRFSLCDEPYKWRKRRASGFCALRKSVF